MPMIRIPETLHFQASKSMLTLWLDRLPTENEIRMIKQLCKYFRMILINVLRIYLIQTIAA